MSSQHSSPPDSLTVPLAPTHGPHGPVAAEVRLAGVENKEKMYEPKQRKKLVRVFTVVAYLFFVSLAAVMLSLYYVFLWNPSPREERQRQQQQQHLVQQQQHLVKQQQHLVQQQQHLEQQQQQLEMRQEQDDWRDDWEQGWSSTSMPDYVDATEILDADVFAYSGQPPGPPAHQLHSRHPLPERPERPEARVVLDTETGAGGDGPTLRHHHNNDITLTARVT